MKANRIDLIRILTGVFFLTGFIMSINLWIPNRFFPLLPYFDIHLDIPVAIEYALTALLFLSLAVAILLNNRFILMLFFALLLLFIFQNQNRWQPWVHIYALLLIPFAIKKSAKQKDHSHYFQIIMIGIYVWSGIHKFNPHFIDATFND